MSLAEAIIKWTIVTLMVIGSVFTISNVGKPRKPLDGPTAAITAVINGLILAAIVVFWN